MNIFKRKHGRKPDNQTAINHQKSSKKTKSPLQTNEQSSRQKKSDSLFPFNKFQPFRGTYRHFNQHTSKEDAHKPKLPLRKSQHQGPHTLHHSAPFFCNPYPPFLPEMVSSTTLSRSLFQTQWANITNEHLARRRAEEAIRFPPISPSKPNAQLDLHPYMKYIRSLKKELIERGLPSNPDPLSTVFVIDEVAGRHVRQTNRNIKKIVPHGAEVLRVMLDPNMGLIPGANVQLQSSRYFLGLSSLKNMIQTYPLLAMQNVEQIEEILKRHEVRLCQNLPIKEFKNAFKTEIKLAKKGFLDIIHYARKLPKKSARTCVVNLSLGISSLILLENVLTHLQDADPRSTLVQEIRVILGDSPKNILREGPPERTNSLIKIFTDEMRQAIEEINQEGNLDQLQNRLQREIIKARSEGLYFVLSSGNHNLLNTMFSLDDLEESFWNVPGILLVASSQPYDRKKQHYAPQKEMDVDQLFDTAFFQKEVDSHFSHPRWYASPHLNPCSNPGHLVAPGIVPGVGKNPVNPSSVVPPTLISGTSFSAPFVSSIIVLMQAAYPSLTPNQIDAIFVHPRVTSLPETTDSNIAGKGFLQPVEAIAMAKEMAILANKLTKEFPHPQDHIEIEKKLASLEYWSHNKSSFFDEAKLRLSFNHQSDTAFTNGHELL